VAARNKKIINRKKSLSFCVSVSDKILSLLAQGDGVPPTEPPIVADDACKIFEPE